MSNYLMMLDDQKKESLKLAEIDFCELEVDSISGVVVEEEDLERALEALAAKRKTESSSSIEGIIVLDLEFLEIPTFVEPTKYRVTAKEHWNGELREEFISIAEEVLVNVVKKDIFLSVPHKATTEPSNDGRFHIYVWSSPDINIRRSKKPPEYIWGNKVNCRDEGFLSSGLGSPIIDEETGWHVAELVGDNLFIHHDVCHFGTKHELSIFRRLCEELVIEFFLSPEEKVEKRKEQARKRKIISRDTYVKECAQRQDRVIRETEKAIKDKKAEIEKLQRKLVSRIREAKGLEKKLLQINSCRGDQMSIYENEYDSLVSVNGVERVEAVEGVIKVFTEHIYITPDGSDRTFDIGKFRMEIYTDGSRNGIRFFNLTRTGIGVNSGYNYHHPHVDEDGEVCLGNISETIASLIAELEYSVIAQIGMQFLYTVNVNDGAGMGIFQYWPEVTKEKVYG